MSVVQIWRMLLARRYLILTMVVVGGIAGAVAAKLAPSYYVAKSRLVVNLLRPDPVTEATVNARSFGPYVQAQTELITTFRVAYGAARKLGWDQSPVLRRAYLAEFPNRQIDYAHWLASLITRSTNAYLIPTTPVLEITYASSSRENAPAVANALRDAFLDETVAMKREVAARNARWFEAQATKLKRDLAAAERRKSNFERANNIVLQDDNSDPESARLRALASSAESQPSVSAVIGGPVSTPSSGQLAALDAELAQARRSLGPNHPDILAMQAKRAALNAAVAREAAATRAAMRGPAAGPSVTNQINSQTQKVLARRGLVGEAQRLAGDVSVLRDQLTKTQQRAADFALEAQSTESGFEVLGNAVQPSAPVTLAKRLYVFGGIGGGIALGLVLAVLIELLVRRVRGPEDLDFAEIPLIGAMVTRERSPGPADGLLHLLGLTQGARPA
ncbi:MAG: hypothetical protein A4S16_10880 [Proteobacteria bacterium SG_bin6]|nr:MAG: hypothetical protein A4S16_10880 [Proteobacteria bacterium SG_bin6]